MRRNILCVLLIASPALFAQDLRDTAVPKGQIANVTRDVAGWHDGKHKDCKFKKVLAATVLEHDDNTSTEQWTIEACDGQQFAYEVFVMPQPGGGMTDMVSDLEEESTDLPSTQATTVDAEECSEMRKQIQQAEAKNDPANAAALTANLAASTCPQE